MDLKLSALQITTWVFNFWPMRRYTIFVLLSWKKPLFYRMFIAMTTYSISASCKGKQFHEDRAKATNLVSSGIKNWESQYLENAYLGEINVLMHWGNATKLDELCYKSKLKLVSQVQDAIHSDLCFVTRHIK